MGLYKWTKGQWEVRVEQIAPTSNETCFTVATDEYDVISPMLGIRKEEDANLIAVAPELYKKLDMLHSYLLEDDSHYAESQEFNEVETLMAKARGES